MGSPPGGLPGVPASELVEVTWVYGAQLGALSGSARAQAQLPLMATEHGRFRVYVVEVCRQCSWNHLVIAYTLGDGILPGHSAGAGRAASAPRSCLSCRR